MKTETPKTDSSATPASSLKSSSGAVATPLGVTLGRYSAIILFAGFTILFGILRPETFLSSTTWRLTISEGVVTAIVALAFLVPLVAGVYDLSVGATMGTALVLMNWFGINHPDIPLWQVAIGVLVFCALIGFCSAVVIVKFRVESLIATLGVSQVLLAFQLFMSDNRQLTGAFDAKWLDLGNGQVFGIPVVALYLVVLSVAIWFVLEHTPVGRRLFAVGGNPEAARLAGLNVERLTYGSLMTSAVIGGFAGIVFSAKVGTYTSTAGPGLLFPALAAVFFGASQFARRPNVWGTLIAYFALAFGVKGLQLTFGPGTFWIQPLFQGAALLIAVALASRVVGQTKRSRKLQREAAAANQPQPNP